MIIGIIFGILVLYLLTVFVGIRLVVPFMGFGYRFRLPSEVLPSDMKQVIGKLEAQASNQKEYLELVYEYIRSNFSGGRFKTVRHPFLAFNTALDTLWVQREFSHCHSINFIFCVMLVESKYFLETDIKIQHTFYNLFIHQYVKVKVGETWIDADPSVTYRNLRLGEHAKLIG